MNRGGEILVATPGRLLDLMNQGFVQLDAIEAFVLDEADRMLDMGFIHDVRKVIAKLPRKRQSLFFSATISPEIVSLAGSMLKNAERVTIAPKQPTVERIQQKVMFVDKARKVELLIWILEEHAMDKVIVFVQRKHVANQITQKLLAAGVVTGVIHGNKSQSARTAALAEFKNGRVRALVATDIAARGLDVDGITHVINYELPNEPEIYIHRIGRTARAGADGDAVSFCMPSERNQLRDIERIIRKQIPVDRDHPAHSEEAEYATGDAARPAKRGSGGQSGGGRNQGGGGNRNRTGNRRGKSSSSPQLHFAPPILRGLAEKSRFGTGRNNEANGNVENGNIASSKKPSDNRGNRNRFRSKGPRR